MDTHTMTLDSLSIGQPFTFLWPERTCYYAGPDGELHAYTSTDSHGAQLSGTAVGTTPVRAQQVGRRRREAEPIAVVRALVARGGDIDRAAVVALLAHIDAQP
jgi:hypothetical protein